MSAAVSLADAAAVERLRTGQRVSDEEAGRLIESRSKALAWAGNPRHSEELAHALTAQALRAAPGTQTRIEMLQQAREALLEGLDRAPADPFLWAHLAYVDGHLLAPPQTVLDSVRRSILAHRLDPTLAKWRLQLAYRHLENWSPELTDLLRSQVRVVATTALDDLVVLGRDPRLSPLIQESLQSDPALLDRYAGALAASLSRANAAPPTPGQGGAQ